MKRVTRGLLILAVVGLSAVSRVQAVPNLINYQGRLTDAVGQPQTGTPTLTFNIYTGQSGGSPVWGPQTFPGTPLVNGYFNVILGNDATSRSVATAFGQTGTAWLEIVVNGTALTPRQQILSAPYAVTAQNAEFADKASFTTVTKTASYTLLGTEDVVFVDGSSGAFTITLPSPVIPSSPRYGEKAITIKRTDSNMATALANPITILGTIDGASDWKLHTPNETYRIVRNGAEWKLLDHYARTPVCCSPDQPLTITATTTAPTKGAIVVDFIRWSRDGSYALTQIRYTQNGTGTPGSGEYMIALPQGLSIDTTRIPFLPALPVTPNNADWLGAGTVGNNLVPSVCNGIVRGGFYAVDATHLSFSGFLNTSNGCTWGSGSNSLAYARIDMGGWVRIPIAGWKD